MSIYLPNCISIYLFVMIQFIFLSIYLSIYFFSISIYLSIYIYIYLCISTNLSIYVFKWLKYIYVFINLYINIYICLSIYLPYYPSNHVFVMILVSVRLQLCCNFRHLNNKDDMIYKWQSFKIHFKNNSW